jgi:hypothetical protein
VSLPIPLFRTPPPPPLKFEKHGGGGGGGVRNFLGPWINVLGCVNVKLRVGGK